MTDMSTTLSPVSRVDPQDREVMPFLSGSNPEIYPRWSSSPVFQLPNPASQSTIDHSVTYKLLDTEDKSIVTKWDRSKRIRLESHTIITEPADRFVDRSTRERAALELAQEIDDGLLLDPNLSSIASDQPALSSSPHVFLHTHQDSDVQRLITIGTNELAAKQARRVLFSALHGLMGYESLWDRGTNNNAYLSRKDVLKENAQLLMNHGIDVTDEDNLSILAGPGFRSNHPIIHSQYVYLVAANLLKTEHRIPSDSIKKLVLAVFTFVTGHRSYANALNPMDRRLINDSGIQSDDDDGVFY